MANFGGPFTYNLLGEILLIVNLASLSLPIVLRAGVISFFSAAYRLILYSSTQQGLRVNGRFSISFTGNDSFTVLVNDPTNINDLLFSQMSGDKILYDGMEMKLAHYLVKFKVTEDKTGGNGCVDYPTTYHKSFSQCIRDAIVKRTRPGLGFVLPFFSDTNQKPLLKLEKHEHVVNFLKNVTLNAIGGKIKPNFCLPPCTILTATSQQQQVYSSNLRRVALNFDDVVEVQTTVLAYGVDSLLVEVGSSLGLWLGLSVVGVFDLLATCLTKMVKGTKQVRGRFLTQEVSVRSGLESEPEFNG